MKFIVSLISFILLAGFGIYWVFFMDGAINISATPEPQITETADDLISVRDQRPGLSVIVHSVSLVRKGYVVIHENSGGQPGRIIGNSRILDEGTSTFVKIGLIRPAMNGEALIVVLHEDSGDGVFSPDVDVVLKNEFGDIIFKRFIISQYADIIEDINP